MPKRPQLLLKDWVMVHPVRFIWADSISCWRKRFLCFSDVFSLSDRSEIRSQQISPIEKKEAEAGASKGSLAKVTQEVTQGDPPSKGKGKGVQVGLTLTVNISK